MRTYLLLYEEFYFISQQVRVFVRGLSVYGVRCWWVHTSYERKDHFSGSSK